MYRTSKTRDLVLKGIPESLRGELWLLFSGNYVSLTAGGTFFLLYFEKNNKDNENFFQNLCFDSRHWHKLYEITLLPIG